ncbi:MAG: exopolysaccharide biosynthesis polyprenyl glycosylphosphotransferase, partial [Angelakisella sp.]
RTYLTPNISDTIVRGADEIHLFDTPLLLCKNRGLSFEQNLLKRIFDVTLTFCALIASSPLFLLIAAAIKLQDGGPVFYKQARLTLDGREFTLYKFRSMIVDAESKCGAQLAQKNDARITPVGRFIRKVRLDELPQLINILRGDMSIVGPRPERPEIVSEYEDYMPEFRFRLKVKAGLTGYAQVLGKYNTTPYDKLKLDLMYIEKYSFLLDIKLILMTIKILFMPASTEGVDDATELTNSLANKS